MEEERWAGVDLEIPPLEQCYVPPDGYDKDLEISDQLPAPDFSQPLHECAEVLAALLKTSAAQPFVGACVSYKRLPSRL